MTMMSATSALVPTKSNALGLGFTGNLGNIDAYISAVNRLPMLTTMKKFRWQHACAKK